MVDFYHEGMRELQDRYEGRAVADRLEQHRRRTEFNDDDIAFIQSVPFFFLATATPESVDCSFKGGAPGFVRVTGPQTLEWPDYDGNRMYRSLGNITASPRVGLLFIRFDGQLFNNAGRLRVAGHAEVDDDPAATARFEGARRIVRVTAESIFPNCPRYIPGMGEAQISEYVPQPGYEPPDPPWKSMRMVRDIFEAERSENQGD